MGKKPQKEGIHIHIRTHTLSWFTAMQQKIQHCKATILQLKKLLKEYNWSTSGELQQMGKRGKKRKFELKQRCSPVILSHSWLLTLSTASASGGHRLCMNALEKLQVLYFRNYWQLSKIPNVRSNDRSLF